MRCRVEAGVTVKSRRGDRHCWRYHLGATITLLTVLAAVCNGGGTSTRTRSRDPPRFPGRAPRRGFGGASFQATAGPCVEDAGGDLYTGCACAKHARIRVISATEATAAIGTREIHYPPPPPPRATRASPPPDRCLQKQIFDPSRRSASARDPSRRASRRRCRRRRLHPPQLRRSACRWRGTCCRSGRR